MITIYNSFTRQKETFQPREPGKVGIYVCGMTVYDYCHIGHARAMIVFDMVVRHLRESGFDVNYVRNITDIDDKIIRRATENNEPVDDLTTRFIAAMHEDERMLGILPPDSEPRATDYIDQIVDIIQNLMDKGFAYQGNNGDVYFAVRKFPDYGHLSGQSIDDLRSGARIEADESKNDPLDFVLWKSAKPGEPQWDSPWGAGRPGWHIECSAMASTCLGETFDIHGGGVDLKFPHHESEIAQSECASGQKFANLWMHNGHVQIDNEKMSKSLGNFFTIREILEQDSQPHRMGECIRYMMLASHYRGPLGFSRTVLDNAKAALTRMYLALQKLEEIAVAGDTSAATSYTERFQTVMNEDFNTPEALAVLFDAVRDLNSAIDANEIDNAQLIGAELKHLGGVLGILQQQPKVFLGSKVGADELIAGRSRAEIDCLVEKRDSARAAKDFTLADQIREELDSLGIVIEDVHGGSTKWRLR
ncbi:MAG: cysteine--tRNA ligase [Gammaproteobacteria bacterium]|nr:cysteine--tRNA ligase [Gammaproteobacteria bacterium]